MNFLGMQSLITIVSHMFFILLSFWALKGIRIEKFIKKNNIGQARVLYLFISITVGYTVSTFFIDLILNSQNLIFLFY
ncbi:conserved hypothetical integral membrane protein [Carnobacterium alterfunditum]|uniref:Conserved hypothetical integral membrane protein n=1 Tax=Carnobacterium alterfunditum TaxID=28230 RepID=A0A1N6HRM5_9LACT|nr:conserved hypothetical integral membrane protein [Carnobacterium alterfunditum]